MRAKEIIRLIPEDTLNLLAAETKVDHQVKKLDGVTMFQLILFSLLHSDKVSLRMMEGLFESMQFKFINQKHEEGTKYNSIRDRIATINPKFFERIFEDVFDTFCKLLKEKDAIVRYDSTMVAISSALVDWGMRVGSKTDKVQLKYTIGMKGSLPCHVKIFDTAEALSEDKTIPEAIFEDTNNKGCIVVFDRGVQKRKTFVKLVENGSLFVTRLKAGAKYKIVKSLPLITDKRTTSLIITEDSLVQLNDTKGPVSHIFRLIKATIKATGEVILFLTNIEEMTAYEIASIYKQRWDIEKLFKFLKQHLNLSHITVRNENGIKVMIYMILILSILLIAYNHFNKITGYKIPLLKFTLDLEKDITKAVVILCGGDTNRMPHLFSDS